MTNQLEKNKQIKAQEAEKGFTLIELSIVLVIIGLIVGGVLVGQDLIRAAEIRATVSQIEKYNTAVNTFRGKYNALPGDLNSSTATAFGFTSRGSAAGQGDGNGVIEGFASSAADGYYQNGETLALWSDLSVGNTASGSALNVNLVDGTFSAYSSLSAQPAATPVSNYMPTAKLGRGNSVYVFSANGVNYWGIENISGLSTSGSGPTATASMTVNQAYQIDKKVDDGFPLAGNVQATLVNGAITENTAVGSSGVVPVNAGTDTSTTCYNSTTTSGAYSLSQNNGNGPNCALSLRFN